jgi:DNA-binding beta-propeller fold protein YncE
MRGSRAATVAAAVLAMVASPAVASAGGGHDDRDGGRNRGGDEVRTVATGLEGPRGLDTYEHGKLVVAESGTGEAGAGEVSWVDPKRDRVRTLLDDLTNPQGVAYHRGKLYVALGEPFEPPGPPPEEAAAATAARGSGGDEDCADTVPRTEGQALIVASERGRVLERYDLLEYELRNNPDGQQQFDTVEGVECTSVDTLSNPFAVHVDSHRILVADAGANAVLAIDRKRGKISTFFVPPVVSPDEVGPCGEVDAQANPGVVGCDPVPTGVTVGKNGLIYVSTLGAEAPGASRVYVLDRKGKVLEVIRDLTGVTGVAVDRDGNVYASELLEGLPEGEPGPDFDPSTVGRIVKIEKDGDREYAQVTMPTGLLIADGKLYASAWSVAGLFLGIPEAGEIVTVPRGAFERSVT